MHLSSLEPPNPDSPVAREQTILTYAADDAPLTPRSRRKANNDKRLGDRKLGNRVLIVGLFRELALYRAEVLQHQGFQVLTPETKEEAVAIIRRGEFDVAVLSYTLPSAVVREIAEEVREHCPDRPIVAIAETKRLDRRIQPDAVVLAEKGPPALITALRRVLRQC